MKKEIKSYADTACTELSSFMHHPEMQRLLLEERKAFLNKVIRKAERSLSNAPAGLLRVAPKGNRPYYYLRKDTHDKNGSYIRADEKGKARRLAQKDYDKKVLKSAQEERKAVMEYLRLLPAAPVEYVYDNLSIYRKPLILPVYQPDEVFAEGWRTEEYEGRSFDSDYPEYTTDHGERVRSKSEIMIANMLFKQGIPYRYEYPIMLDGMGIVHPDFLILNVRLRKEILWEHLGRMDDPGYAAKNIRKLIAYARNGYMQGDNLILTAETAETPIPMDVVAEMMKKYLL